jgi:hypothetical protein
VPAISAVIQQRARPGDAVAHYRVALPSMAFYLRRHFDGFDSRADFIAYMRERSAYAVMRAEDYRDVAPELGPQLCVVGEWDWFQAKLKDVLAHRPLPKVVLIYNRCEP